MVTDRQTIVRVGRLALLAVLAVLFSACGLLSWADTKPCDESWYGTRITLPASATVLEERCRSGFNPDYRVVFTIPSDDLEVAQALMPVTAWTASAEGLLNFDAEAARATEFMAGRFMNGAIAVEAVIDMSDPARYTIYYQSTFID